ncbi:hypothetical protein BH23BAC1_BH23BAC1_13340 [soil metagenome]
MRKKLLILFFTVLAGYYTTDSYGQCMTSFTVTNINDASCNGGGDGEITVTVTDGRAPFTYEIFLIDGGGEIPLGSIPGTMSQSVTFGVAYGNIDDPITGLPAYSNYRVRVTSSETNLTFGCKVRTISGIDITEPSILELSADSQPDCGSNSGSISLVVTGGSPNFSYSWTGPTAVGNIANPTGLAAGIYSVTVIDQNNCTETLSNIILEAGPNVTISPVAPMCISNSAFNLSAATAGGTWSGTGITNASLGTFDPSVAGQGSWIITYTLTANGCTKSDTETIEILPAPDATISSAGPFCIDGSAVNLIAATAGGTWSGPGIINMSNGTFDPATAGVGTHIISYEVTINGCTSTDTENIVVNLAPDATISATGPYCSNETSLSLLAATAGGIWSGTGITNASAGIFDPAIAGAGSHIITYEVTMNGCTSTDTETIVVNAVPNATITPVSPVCVNSAAFILSAVTSGGTWSGTGITNPSAGTFDPATAGAGSHNITYQVTVEGCTSTDTEIIEVTPLPDATITPAGPFCSDTDAVNLSAATSGGIWSGTGITNASAGTFNPGTAGAGSHIITYEIIINGCTSTDTETIVVNATPNASITPVSPVCVNAEVFDLTAAITGGNWSGTGITNASAGTFDPATAGQGSHIITYEITINGCTSSDTETIVVDTAPDATITPVEPVCNDASVFNLTAATTGGTWSGIGITNTSAGTFNPAIAGTGSHEISYEVIINGCTSTEIEIIEVIEIPDATINPVGTVCESSAAFNLSAATNGGTWSGPGITDTSAGTFDPATAGPGTHAINYEITINGCTSSDIINIEVTPLPDATISPVAAKCTNEEAFNLTAATGGGTWSGTGIVDGTTGTFDPAIAGAGSHIITYEITINGCTSTDTETIVVNVLPDATISPAGPVCVNAEAFDLTAATTGGNWSGPGITNASAGTFDPATAGPGSHIITYQLTINGCTSSDTETIVVDTAPDATIAPVEPVCNDASVFNLTAATTGGTWSGIGISNTSAGTFNPAIAGPGSHEIIYEVIINGCTSTDIEIIEVMAIPDATINPVGAVCESSAAFNLSAATIGGTWSGPGITNSSAGTFDPSSAGTGTHAINYEITMNGCTSSDIINIEVTPMPDATIVPVAAICNNDEAFNLTAATGGGTWSGTGIIDGTTGTFDPAISGPGSWTITYTLILNGCNTYDTETIVVTPSPEAPVAEVPHQACINTAVDNLSASGTDLKWYSVENLTTQIGSGEILDPSPFIDNTVAGSFNFYVTQTISGCESLATIVTLQIIDSQPDPPIVSNVTVCTNSEAELTAGGSDLEWYSDDQLTILLSSGPSFSPDPLIYDNSVTGSFTFYVTQSLPGCGKSAGAAIVLNYIDDTPAEAPVANLESGETCNSFVVIWTSVAGTGYRYDLSDQSDFSTFLANNDAVNGNENRNTFHNLTAGNTYFFRVRSENSCGIGPSSNVVSITLPSVSQLPVASSPEPICINEDIPVINVPGNNIKWYNDEELTDLVYNGNSFQPVGIIDNTAIGSYNFYVTQTSGTCSESEAIDITITYINDASCTQDCESSDLAINLNTITHATCFAPTSGSATVAASGGAAPYNFSWLNSNNELIGSSSTVANLPEGNYVATVTDNFGCSRNLTVFIYESILITTTISPQTNCEPDGAIFLHIEGGSGDYIYQWSNANGFQSSSADINNLEYGVYDLTVLDLNTFCSKELAGIEVDNNVIGNCNECENPSLEASVSDIVNPGCSGEAMGSASIQASGSATGNYFYSINNGSTWISFVPGELIVDLPSGQYNLLIGDKEMDSCPANIEFTIAEPSGGLFANVKNSSISFPDQPTGSISIDQISGGNSPYRAKISLKIPSFPDQQLELGWNNIPINPNTMDYELHYNNLYSGRYEVTIQDDNGCEIVLEVDLDFDRSILIPNVFTPNGDGYNDTFYIRNLPEVGTQLVVANKWGKTVFESKDYRNNWTGGDLPEGVYYYSMVTMAGTKYNGWVEIWRGPAF